MRTLLLLAAGLAIVAPARATAQSRCPFGSEPRSGIGISWGPDSAHFVGRVMRASTGEPLANVLITLRTPEDSLETSMPIWYEDGRVTRQPYLTRANEHMTRTDSAGRFRMTAVPARSYRLRVSPTPPIRGVGDTITVGGEGLTVLIALGEGHGRHTCMSSAPTGIVPPAS